MSQPFRVDGLGSVDRSRPLAFTFDGVAYEGCAGDTLASALLANGVHLVGRSYKYHRPRGILSAGAEEPNALVSLSRGPGRFTPNLRATQIELDDWLSASSQNRWPSLAFDVGAINDLLSPLFGAGFYYKTFMGPNLFGKNWAWTHVYEPAIRRAAGLAAALAASASGARVVVCDENPAPGGSLLAEAEAGIETLNARDWLAKTVAELRERPNLRLMTRTQAFGYYAQNFVALNERIAEPNLIADPDLPRERLWQIRAREVVLATGAIERPLVFPDNDRPGVMLADAARRYCRQYGVKVGERVVVATAHDGAYRAALDLKAAGLSVALIADLRREVKGPLPEAARAAGLEVAAGAEIVGVDGRLRVKAVRVNIDGASRTIACDAILMSGGWTPSVHLFSQSRGRLVFDQARQVFKPGRSAQRERSAGACNATFDLAGALAEGDAAGRAAAAAAGFTAPNARVYAVSGALPASDPVSSPLVGEDQGGGSYSPTGLAGGAFDNHDSRRDPPPLPAPTRGGRGASAIDPTGAQKAIGAAPPLHADRRAKAFVDFQNDVCSKDVNLAVREGMRSIEHIKRYTTTGMATDQGKLSNMNALAIAARALAKPVPEVGLTTFRPPYTPVSFGAFAGPARGDLFDPIRRTPIHDWAAENGAAFEDVGPWKRAWYFPRPGESMHDAVARECRTTRASVGLFDATTLGKIEVVGPDAATFLERMYANAFQKLEVGRCRYGLMLSEAGFLIDDGVIARLKPDRFHVTTTTGGAPTVLAQMEDYLQTEFTDLKVWLTSTTEQWATIAVQGPKARDCVAPLVDGIDLANEAFAHMTVREARVCGVPARLMRVSFTGELGYEINVPSHFGRAVWEAAWQEVEKRGGCAYGTEAMHVMRAEKGFVIVGQETDGTVTLADLGLDWAIGKMKKDFVGKRSLIRPDMLAANRKHLVGLLTDDPAIVLEEGAQVTESAKPPTGSSALGHVTSSYASTTLSRSIALALVAAGRSRIGAKLNVPMPGGAVPVTVTAPIFYDKPGARLHV